ncbi:hypothetical protein RKD55_004206 [Rossellomorea marisflavi]
MRRLDFLPVESKGLQRRGMDSSPSPPLQYRDATHDCNLLLKMSNQTPLTHRVNRRGGHLTPTGIEGCSRPRKHEEARLTPRGKQGPAAQRNGPFTIAISLNTGRHPISVIDIKKQADPKRPTCFHLHLYLCCFPVNFIFICFMCKHEGPGNSGVIAKTW